MYTKEINPIISESLYNSFRELFRLNMKDCYSHYQLSKHFINLTKHIYKIDVIVTVLGVSQKHIYRIMKKEYDFSKGDQLNTLVFNIFASKDYRDFIKTCADTGIVVKEK